MLQASPLPARPRLEHVVRLYEGAEALAGEVASFALQGVREGSAVLVIATREHAPLFREAMQRRGLAVASLEGVGQLRFVEAEGLLEQFCPGGVLDRARFTELLGALIETGQARFGRVRAFGEMVNLLWSRGERTTALALEECWDGLIASTSLGLLCAYDLRGFSGQDDHEAFAHVCSAHTRVMPSERKVGAATSEADRDRLLAELQQRALALETEVRRNRALAEEARAAVHQRDEVLSIASHELKTPLASLQILVQGLLRMNPAKTREPVEKALAKASARLNLLGVLVDDLLDASQLTSEPFALERAEVSLGAIARRVVTRFLEPAEEAGTMLRLELRTDSVGHWDRRRLEQVLGHLLTNGIKHAGGSTVHVVVERTDDAARILVRDTGRGIAEQDQQRIFHRFERHAPARRGGGFGLGLWLSRAIVEAHGGTLTVQSALGAGATFVVSLPLGG